MSYNFINTKAGIIIPKETIHSILTRLGFIFEVSDEVLTIKVPSHRASKDISIQEDIAEEVIRVFGYDNIPASPLQVGNGINKKNTTKTLKDNSLSFWKNQTWNEVYNYSFTNESLDKAILLENIENAVGIQNAFNVEYTHMRRSLALRLFENVKNNKNIQSNLRFFEIGKVYNKNQSYSIPTEKLLKNTNESPYGERPMIAGVSTMDNIETLRKSLEKYLRETLGFVPPLHQDNTTQLTFLHPGISGQYREGDIVFITFGQVHPETAEAFDIPANTLYWE